MIVKGFAEITALIANAPATTAPFGELPPQGLTFSPEVGYYTSSQVSGYRFIALLCQDDSASPVMLPTGAALTTLQIMRAVHTFASAQTLYTKAELIAEIQSLFPTLTQVNFGPLVVSGSLALPTWGEWTLATSPATVCTVWFHGESLITEYDEYSVVVASPLPVLDDYFLTAAGSAAKLQAALAEDTLARLTVLVADRPPTRIRGKRFAFHSAVDNTVAGSALWYAAIYGPRGDTPAAIKSAIRQLIAAQSSRPQADWVLRLPELYTSPEMILRPLWERVAIESSAIRAGIYSATVALADKIALMQTLCSDYSPALVEERVELVTSSYKNLAILAVGGPDNAIGKQTFSALFPDYLPYPPTSLDYSRMSQATRDFAELLVEALVLAETFTTHTPLPAGFQKVKRQSHWFISFDYLELSILVKIAT